MICHEARRLLSPYLDSELDPAQTFEIGLHLQECEACRERFAAEQEVDRAVVKRLQTGAMPAELWDTIQRRVLNTPRRTPRFYWGGIMALAACILIAVIAGRRYFTAPITPKANEWIIAQFQTQDSAPAAVDSSAAQSLAQLAQDTLHRGIRMNFAAEATNGHQVELLSVSRDSAAGSNTLLVRLRCCGQPVLVAISSAASPGPLGDIAKVASGQSGFQSHVGDVNVAAWRFGDLVIAAVSRHPVAQLEGVIQVTAS